MRLAHDAERVVGIDWYASDVPGTGGRLREQPEDFRVRELETVDPEPVGADPAAFPHLLVRATLRGWDTNDFAGRLSDALGVSRERVGWAGTKDKHAVTTQLFSIRDVDPDDVPEMGDAELTVVGRFGRSLAFGDLAGNAFEIRVQQPERPENAAAVTEALRAGDPDTDSSGGDSPHQAGSSADSVVGDGRAESAATVAVPNYFGHQRFGSQRAVTHEVGLRVVRGDWRGAVLAYCGNPSETEPTPTRAARRFVDEQAASEDPDWRAAAEAATLDGMTAAVAASEADPAVRRAARNHLDLAASWGAFAPDGLAATDLATGGATVLDCAGLGAAPTNAVTGAVASALYDARVAGRLDRLPWLLVDEAHVVLDGAAEPALETLLTRGRAPGVSLVAATQRPAALPAVAVSQADLLVAHRLTARDDVEALARAAPTYLDGRLRDRLPTVPGAAVVVDDATESVHGVRVRERATPHGGAEPRASETTAARTARPDGGRRPG